MSVVFGLILIVVVFISGGFFWAWWAIPRDRVPPHLTGDDLKRLETEDRLRQTNYQLLAGGALVFTFCLTVYQALTSYTQWASDYSLRTRQAEVTHLSEALKALSLEKNPAARAAGYFSLKQLAAQYPEQESELVMGVLTQSIRGIANEQDTFANVGFAKECQVGGAPASTRPEREEANAEVQVAMMVLGHPDLAAYRPSTFDGATCTGTKTSLSNLNLSHLALNDLDLQGSNFSCGDLSQSKLRRTSFRNSILRGANFSGANFDDWATPGFIEVLASNVQDNVGKAGAKWLHHTEEEWRRYRCWITDFRRAKLNGAKFDHAGLAGVDFSEADLTGASFDGANVSRANFEKAILDPAQLFNACADGQPLLDKDVKIASCKRR